MNQIDQIVREVMRRLEQVPAGETASPKLATVDNTDSTTLRVDDRLVTVDRLGSRLNGIRRIEVSDDAVVTPLVKDLLKEKSIKLQRVTRCQFAARRWLLVEPGRCHAKMLLEQLRAIDAEWMPTSDWQAVVDSVAAGDSAMVVTPNWAARVCQANRRETVRAVHVVDTATLQQALDQTDANMLVMDASQGNELAVAEIARVFVDRSR